MLEYYYIESAVLKDAEEVYEEIVDKLEQCIPDGMIKLDEPESQYYLGKAHYIDVRDKDAFVFYDWPEFEITLTNMSGNYVVKLRALSKKFD